MRGKSFSLDFGTLLDLLAVSGACSCAGAVYARAALRCVFGSIFVVCVVIVVTVIIVITGQIIYYISDAVSHINGITNSVSGIINGIADCISGIAEDGVVTICIRIAIGYGIDVTSGVISGSVCVTVSGSSVVSDSIVSTCCAVIAGAACTCCVTIHVCIGATVIVRTVRYGRIICCSC